MAKVTMQQIIDSRGSINLFGNTNIPLKGAYKINKIKKNLEKEVDFYGTKMQEIIDKYAKKDENGELVFSEDGSQIQIQEEKIDECNQALEELQNLEVDIETYNLKIEDLGDNLECTPDDLGALMFFMD